MSKISELSDGGVIQGGDTLIAVRSGGNVKVTYGGTTTANIDGGTIDNTVIGGTTPAAGNFTTGSFTGNVSFGDNDKAIFGAGSDLQIYHDGVSRIKELGAGGLYVDVTNDMYIRRGDTSAVMAEFNAGVAKLMFDGSQKLATTSTGIDVTGSVTADGLTLQASEDVVSWASGNGIVQAPSNLYVRSSGTGDVLLQSDSTAVAKFEHGGDISFYESTGTTPKFFWDSSAESLGIGGGTLASKLFVNTDAVGDSYFRGGADNSRQLDFTTFATASPNAGHQINALSINGVITLAINGTERMRISSDGSCRWTPDGTNHDMTLDASGNLLVGTTSESTWESAAGFRARSSGSTTITRDGNPPLYVNRLNSDGTLLQFQKGTAVVGSIGSNPSSYLYIGLGDTTLSFSSASDLIYPTGTSGAQRDGFVNLGNGANRFKDLYLSGGVVFGATGGNVSSKTLDDYEEGTWTPAFSSTGTAPTTSAFSITNATYTKVGRKVHIQAYITATFSNLGSGIATITGLPFTPVGYSVAVFEHCDLLLCNGGYVTDGNARIVAITPNTTGGITYRDTGTSRSIMLSAEYETNE